ncbi:MAG: hypothetical protein ACTHLW_04280 [Verrucomicrobiota bacterium]
MNPEPPVETTEPIDKKHFHWGPALGAGCIAGLVLMIVPRASPWSALTFAAPVIMGRVVPEQLGVLATVTKFLHLGLALLYGLIVSLAVMRITQLRALIVGAIVGSLLYLANYWIVTAWFPALHGDEPTVLFTHLVFGAIAGGAYRGLLQRKIATVRPKP